jgi:hypothetical protein
MRKSIAAAVSATAPAAMAGGTGVALASTHGAHPAVSGTEPFQMMTTSATSSVDPVIASGVFTAPGADHESNSHNTSKFVFPQGTVRLRHSPGKGRQTFNPRSCLLTISEHGAYKLTGGTGRYTGITAAAITS